MGCGWKKVRGTYPISLLPKFLATKAIISLISKPENYLLSSIMDIVAVFNCFILFCSNLEVLETGYC